MTKRQIQELEAKYQAAHKQREEVKTPETLLELRSTWAALANADEYLWHGVIHCRTSEAAHAMLKALTSDNTLWITRSRITTRNKGNGFNLRIQGYTVEPEDEVQS